MKHNTHIYLAAKAIEFLREAVRDLRTLSGRRVSASVRRAYAAKAKRLQRLLRFHQDDILEASWAPDDLLGDQRRFHTFKLFTSDVLPIGADDYTKLIFRGHYRRGSGAGGVPYRVDHLAALISDFRRLHDYNDHFTVRQVQYLYLLISHYVVDAHVPMHCDLRDDRPGPASTDKPGPIERYFDPGLHARVERIWDRAVTPVALREGIIVAETYKDHHRPTPLSEAVTFDVRKRSDRETIRAMRIPKGGLMDWMIDLCVKTYERSLRMFPVKGVKAKDAREGKGSGEAAALGPEDTRMIMSEAITGLVSVWLAIG